MKSSSGKINIDVLEARFEIVALFPTAGDLAI
jgi:hypothetical protein